MATDREIALEVALISVIAAAEKGGVGLEDLLNRATQLVLRYPSGGSDRDIRIADACAEISNAHAAVVTGERIK